VRPSWFVERIARGASKPHWRAERATLSEVLDDLHAAEAAGDMFRFIAPWHATDEELDALVSQGAMPTFPGPDDSDVDGFLSELVSKNLKKVGGVERT
jgi:hypothetical protein